MSIDHLIFLLLLRLHHIFIIVKDLGVVLCCLHTIYIVKGFIYIYSKSSVYSCPNYTVFQQQCQYIYIIINQS